MAAVLVAEALTVSVVFGAVGRYTKDGDTALFGFGNLVKATTLSSGMNVKCGHIAETIDKVVKVRFKA